MLTAHRGSPHHLTLSHRRVRAPRGALHLLGLSLLLSLAACEGERAAGEGTPSAADQSPPVADQRATDRGEPAPDASPPEGLQRVTAEVAT